MKQMSRYETNSSITTGTSLDNYRFKSSYKKLVDDINKISHKEKSEGKFSVLYQNLKSSFVKTCSETSKINNYKMNKFMHENFTGKNSHRPSSLSKKQHKEILKESFKFDINKLKISTEMKDKYKNILDYGLKSLKPLKEEPYIQDKIKNMKSDLKKLLEPEVIKSSPLKKFKFKSPTSKNKEQVLLSMLSKKEEENQPEDYFQNTKRLNKMKEVVSKTLKGDSSPQKNAISSPLKLDFMLRESIRSIKNSNNEKNTNYNRNISISPILLNRNKKCKRTLDLDNSHEEPELMSKSKNIDPSLLLSIDFLSLNSGRSIKPEVGNSVKSHRKCYSTVKVLEFN